MATPQSVLFTKKSNADALTYIQGFYPTVTGVVLNLDGSILITASDALAPGDRDDIMQILASSNMWSAATV